VRVLRYKLSVSCHLSIFHQLICYVSWPTGGWGSVEYGVADPSWTAGQVPGGRWKPLQVLYPLYPLQTTLPALSSCTALALVQHFFESHLYRDVISVCGFDGRCYLKNDDAVTLAGFPTATSTRQLVRVDTGSVVATWQTVAALPRGGGSISWFCMDNSSYPACSTVQDALSAAGCAVDGSDCLLDVRVSDGPGPSANTLSYHTAFLTAPAAVLVALSAQQPLLNATVGTVQSDGTIPVTLTYEGDMRVTTAGLPLLVTLTSTFSGRFSANAFTPLSLPVIVSFLPWAATPEPQVFAETLRVQHLGQYKVSNSN
jgi:hypothetical protein